MTEPEIPATELAYLRDAYVREFESAVVGVRPGAVALATTYFYPTGGGQPHDLGVLTLGASRLEVSSVHKEGQVVWHNVEGGVAQVGDLVQASIDWERRHRLMRTHTAMHILSGVIWNRWQVPVTGGNMDPMAARMDFEFDPLPEGFASAVEQLVNEAIAANHPIEVYFIERESALRDEDLIRTKVSLIPESVKTIRVVDILGLDKQADGGTHVASTAEVGRFRVVKTESKGKGNKRLRVEIL